MCIQEHSNQNGHDRRGGEAAYRCPEADKVQMPKARQIWGRDFCGWMREQKGKVKRQLLTLSVGPTLENSAEDNRYLYWPSYFPGTFSCTL